MLLLPETKINFANISLKLASRVVLQFEDGVIIRGKVVSVLDERNVLFCLQGLLACRYSLIDLESVIRIQPLD